MTQHTVVIPASVVVGGVTYNNPVWENGSTALTRVVDVTTDVTITMTYQPVSPSGGTFGNTTVGANIDVNDPDAQYLSYFTCNFTGQVTDIFAYIAGQSAGHCKVAIYATSGGVATTLLGQAPAVAIGTGFSWVNFKLPSAVNVTSGTTYALALLGDVSIAIALVAGTGLRGYGSGSYASGFRNPYGTIWWTDPAEGAMSIYAQGATAPPPNFTVTINSTPIQGITITLTEVN